VQRHREGAVLIAGTPDEAFVDDHSRFASHMSQSSWMMGGGRMLVDVDGAKGRAVGSHIRLKSSSSPIQSRSGTSSTILRNGWLPTPKSTSVRSSSPRTRKSRPERFYQRESVAGVRADMQGHFLHVDRPRNVSWTGMSSAASSSSVAAFANRLRTPSATFFSCARADA
jgi:hypothetical protein